MSLEFSASLVKIIFFRWSYLLSRKWQMRLSCAIVHRAVTPGIVGASADCSENKADGPQSSNTKGPSAAVEVEGINS